MKDLINFRLQNQELQYIAVKHLWNSSTLLSIGGHSFETLLGKYVILKHQSSITSH